MASKGKANEPAGELRQRLFGNFCVLVIEIRAGEQEYFGGSGQAVTCRVVTWRGRIEGEVELNLNYWRGSGGGNNDLPPVFLFFSLFFPFQFSSAFISVHQELRNY